MQERGGGSCGQPPLLAILNPISVFGSLFSVSFPCFVDTIERSIVCVLCR